MQTLNTWRSVRTPPFYLDIYLSELLQDRASLDYQSQGTPHYVSFINFIIGYNRVGCGKGNM